MFISREKCCCCLSLIILSLLRFGCIFRLFQCLLVQARQLTFFAQYSQEFNNQREIIVLATDVFDLEESQNIRERSMAF